LSCSASRLEANATCVPSGDTAGSVSVKPVVLVRSVRAPFGARDQRSVLPLPVRLKLVKTIAPLPPGTVAPATLGTASAAESAATAASTVRDRGEWDTGVLLLESVRRGWSAPILVRKRTRAHGPSVPTVQGRSAPNYGTRIPSR